MVDDPRCKAWSIVSRVYGIWVQGLVSMVDDPRCKAWDIVSRVYAVRFWGIPAAGSGLTFKLHPPEVV